jgi:hypothetical protein
MSQSAMAGRLEAALSGDALARTPTFMDSSSRCLFRRLGRKHDLVRFEVRERDRVANDDTIQPRAVA